MSGGLVVYRGPSTITGGPIRAILTARSSNRKTGNMVQLTILTDNGQTPTQAARSGADSAVCGSCVYRGQQDPETGEWAQRGCYVILAQAPTSIAKKDDRRGYAAATPEEITAFLKGRKVRLGLYGNPSALPYSVLEPIARAADGWTGYSSDHVDCDPAYSNMLMASVQSVEAAKEAHSRGWRTFRSAPEEGFTLLPNEILCPAESHGTKCIDCLACAGTRFGTRSRAVSVAIMTHGTGKTHANAVATNN